MNIFLKFVSLFILLTFSPNASSSNLTQEKKESNISYNYYPYSTFTKNHLIYPVRHYSDKDKVSTKQVSPFTKLRNLQDSTEDNSSTEEINTDSVNTHSFFSDGSRPSVLAALEAKRKETSVRDMDALLPVRCGQCRH